MTRTRPMQPGLLVQEDKQKSDFIDGFMGADGQIPGHPWNAAKAAPSWFASKDDSIGNGYLERTIPYGDRKYIQPAESDLQYVQPTWAAARVMAPRVRGSDVPGATADAAFQPGTQLMPQSDMTRRIDAAMQQNVPPPQNMQPAPITPEARGVGMSTSVASPGAGPQRNVPPPKSA